MRAEFDALGANGEIATCDPVEAELLWTARSLDEFDDLRLELSGFPRFRVDVDTWDRSFDVWRKLVVGGRHRQVKHVDLLIAAVAERAGIPVVHYDRDFAIIAEVTGQPTRPIAPLGSL